MFSRLFNTSQPFHYLVGMVLLGPISILLLFLLSGFWQWSFLAIGILLPLALSLFQFIILKNELTSQNSYGLFAFTMLTLGLLLIEVEWEFVVCLLLFLLALRRLLSLKTGTATIRKIFDGTFWISIATLLQPAMAIFYFAVFTAIFLFDRTKWRHWATPFMAIACVLVLSFTWDVFTPQPILTQVFYSYNYSLESLIEGWQSHQALIWILCSIAAIGFAIYIIKLVDIQQRVRPRFSVLVMAGICSLLLTIFLEDQFVLLLIPVLAIFQVRALEHMSHKGLREFIFLVPVLLILLAFFTRP